MLAKVALWRLRGPGHRVAAVQRHGGEWTVWAYLERDGVSPAAVSAQMLGLRMDAQERGLAAPRTVWRTVRSWDWPVEFKRRIGAQEVGERLLVVPSWRATPPSDRIALRLDSRMGFGGLALHPTTHLCLVALERRLAAAGSAAVVIADIGCGAGVLSVAAALLGAERVYAVDTKAAAVAGTRANLRANSIAEQRVVVARGSVAEIRDMLPAPVDGFVCNILTPIIVPLIPRFAQISRVGTWALLSGVREAELHFLDEPLRTHGWQVDRVDRLGGWCCVECVKVGA